MTVTRDDDMRSSAPCTAVHERCIEPKAPVLKTSSGQRFSRICALSCTDSGVQIANEVTLATRCGVAFHAGTYPQLDIRFSSTEKQHLAASMLNCVRVIRSSCIYARISADRLHVCEHQ